MRIAKAHESGRDLNVQEMIRVAIQSRTSSARSVTSKKAISDTLFLARERLPAKNPLRRSLAFYWYLDGPYSEVVDDSLQALVDKKKVYSLKNRDWHTYRLAPEHALRPVIIYDTPLEEVAGEIKRVAGQFANTDDLVRHAYETAAPTRWYVSYKLEFMPKFESYCRDVCAGRSSRYTPLQILAFLDDAVLDFPMSTDLLATRLIFMDFSKILNALLRWDGHQTRGDLLGELSSVCVDIWDVFACGIRIHHHDECYEGHVDAWRRTYEDKVRRLDREMLERVKKFDGIVVDDMRLTPDLEDMVLHPEQYVFTTLEDTPIAGSR